MTPDELDRALAALGQVLADRSIRYQLAVIGGGSLMLLELIDRPTRDLDIVAIAQADNALVYADPFPGTVRDRRS